MDGILIVDDERLILETMADILEADGLGPILTEQDPFLVERHIEEFSPGIIILDLTMPGMDGFTVIESLKSIPQTSNIPIIIVSAREISAEENEFLTGRIEVLLNKGALTEKDLLAVVNQALD